MCNFLNYILRDVFIINIDATKRNIQKYLSISCRLVYVYCTHFIDLAFLPNYILCMIMTNDKILYIDLHEII